jgi:hypothetical protein
MATRVVFWDERTGVAMLQNTVTGRVTRVTNMTHDRLAKLADKVAAEESRRAKAGVRATELFAFSSTPDGVTHR